VAFAAISAAMYRLQQTGDPLVIVWAAGAIVLLTVAATVAKALEGRLCRFFGLDTEDNPREPPPGVVDEALDWPAGNVEDGAPTNLPDQACLSSTNPGEA
jgi:hypothetical protein